MAVIWVTLPWILIGFFTLIRPSPSKPDITYGEFPFRLEYKINESTVVVEDTLICEFSGFGANEGVGKYREWTATLASGNERIVLYEFAGTSGLYLGTPDDKEEAEVELYTTIYFSPGNAGYYMGDEYAHGADYPDASYFIERNGFKGQEGVAEADILLNEFGIELISWEISDPIVNQFG